MATFSIRLFPDPVLRQASLEVENIDGTLAKLADDMIETMYEAPGVGLAAPQIGVQRRMFVYDIGDGPNVVVNPAILESSGEWSYQEGCLSIPGMYWDLVRPKQVLLRGYNLAGEELEVEADELLARCFQHEMDHLDGVLVLERIEPAQRKEAMAELRRRALQADPATAPLAGLRR
jgi:peptide deformylase